jgi:holo-[acyl-carrier protein] synthase
MHRYSWPEFCGVQSRYVNPHLEYMMIIGTGVDLVEIERFRKVLDKTKDRFILRVFTPEEQVFCNNHRDPIPHYAVRFAAKEALFKALGTGWAKGVTWLNVEVLREHANAPSMNLSGEARRLSDSFGTDKIHISLSHTDQWAIATVILENAATQKSQPPVVYLNSEESR